MTIFEIVPVEFIPHVLLYIMGIGYFVIIFSELFDVDERDSWLMGFWWPIFLLVFVAGVIFDYSFRVHPEKK